jgi:hypothetical protein
LFVGKVLLERKPWCPFANVRRHSMSIFELT